MSRAWAMPVGARSAAPLDTAQPLPTALPAEVPMEAPAEPLSLIADDLEETERVLQATLASARPGVAELIAHLGHYRGKRLRPAILLLVARACGRVTLAHHVLAAVVEMIHTATLVH